MLHRSTVAASALAAVLIAASQTATAQTYPAKAVRLVVSFTPGGGSDIVGRGPCAEAQHGMPEEAGIAR